MVNTPNISNVRVDSVLQNYLQAYENAAFVADTLAPRFKVKVLSGIYYKMGMERFYREDVSRSPGAWANEVRFDVNKSTFSCDIRSASNAIPDIILDVADGVLQLRMESADICKDKVALDREFRVRDKILAGVTQTVTLNAGQKWDNYTSATSLPINNIVTGRNTIRRAIWKTATHIFLPSTVAEVLSMHPQVISLIKNTDSRLLTDSGLPPKIRGLQVVEMGAGYVDSETSTDPEEIWGDNVIIAFINPKPGLRTINGMTTFAYLENRVRRFRDERGESEYVEYTEILGEELVNEKCFYIIKDVLA